MNSTAHRILEEVHELNSQEQDPCMKAWLVDPANPFLWRAYVRGPQGTPYEGGCFSLRIEFPQNFPFEQPRVAFNTKICHINISDDGSSS
jgi:ubiquitin-protein ligase